MRQWSMKDAVDELDPEVRAAIEESVRRFPAPCPPSQVPAPFHTDLAEGARVSERWIRCSVSACMCRVARPSTRAPSS